MWRENKTCHETRGQRHIIINTSQNKCTRGMWRQPSINKGLTVGASGKDEFDVAMAPAANMDSQGARELLT